MILSLKSLLFIVSIYSTATVTSAETTDANVSEICRATCTTDSKGVELCKFTAKLNLHASELGYFQFEECGDVNNPTLGMEVGKSYMFDQADVSNQ